MKSPKLPSAGPAEVRIVAADPKAARHVAEILRRCFAATAARSYPAGADGGTRLHLTVDTTRMAEPVRSWLLTSQSSGTITHSRTKCEEMAPQRGKRGYRPRRKGFRRCRHERQATMATLHERQHYREAIMKSLYEAMEGNRLLGLTGAQLREELAMPEEDLAAACTYLAAEGLIQVDWARGNTPAMVTLLHKGIQLMETEEKDSD